MAVVSEFSSFDGGVAKLPLRRTFQSGGTNFGDMGGGVAKLPLRRTFQSGGTNFGDMGVAGLGHKHVIIDPNGKAIAIVRGKPIKLGAGYTAKKLTEYASASVTGLGQGPAVIPGDLSISKFDQRNDASFFGLGRSLEEKASAVAAMNRSAMFGLGETLAPGRDSGASLF